MKWFKVIFQSNSSLHVPYKNYLRPSVSKTDPIKKTCGLQELSFIGDGKGYFNVIE